MKLYGREQPTNPNIRLYRASEEHDPVTKGILEAVLRSLVTHAGLLRILGGFTVVSLGVLGALATWTVSLAGQPAKAIEARLDEHVKNEHEAMLQLRKESSEQLQVIDGKVSTVIKLMLESNVRRRRSPPPPAP